MARILIPAQCSARFHIEYDRKMYRDKSDDIVSVYQIQYHPMQVFEMIKPMLWCPGFSGARMAMELMRDMFW